MTFNPLRRGGWSLAHKLTVTITTLVVVVVGGITLLSIQREQRAFRTELQSQADVLLDALEIVVRDPLYRLDTDFVAEMMIALGKNHGLIVSGHAYDQQGRMIADAIAHAPIYTTSIDALGQKLVNSDETVYDWQSQQLVAGRAVQVGKQRLGAISIGLSTAPLQEKIVGVRNRGIGVALAAGLTGSIVALFTSRSITKPLQELVRVTRQITRGDLSQRVQIESRDELAVVAEAFNDMATQLQHTLTLLERNNESLELRIRERTQELSQALNHLQETQAHLVQSEKMSSLGQLVAGVAHEINNPVTFIHGNLAYADDYIQKLLTLLQLYQQQYPQPADAIQQARSEMDLEFLEEDLPKLLESMKLGSNRILEIVKSLRVFSRHDEAEFKSVNIHEGIDSTLMILASRLSNVNGVGINVVKTYGNLPPIDCYPGQLNQVFMNILSNAIDALEEGIAHGKFMDYLNEHLDFDWRNGVAPTISIRTEIVCDEWISIYISDNGLGISESAQSKLFDPFFTTKSIGKGTGLGLSISYQIITEKHKGTLQCQSTPGQGTEFVIEIPTQQPSAILNVKEVSS